MFVLIDCNNFYASCERVFRPDLLGKPVVVLSNNDGCVIARSNEAKHLGVPMGAPAFKYERFFEQNKIHVFSANFALYGDMSQRIMSIVGEFSPDIEIYSIDEAFLKFEGFEKFDLLERIQEMQEKVFKWTSISVSVGLAPTKALAKVANRIAKKFPEKTDYVYSIDNEEKRLKALRWLAVEDVWGIGRKHARRLKDLQVHNAYAFTQLSDLWVKKYMSVVGLRLKRDLLGKPTLDLDDFQASKNISVTRSFEENYTHLSDLKERVSTFAVTCAQKLRKQKSHCNSLLVFLHTNAHRSDLPQYRQSIVVQASFPTNSSIELSKLATQALVRIYREGYAYKKAGVIVFDFTPEANFQLNLFQNSDLRHNSLMKVVDQLNSVFGQQKIKLATQDLKRTWKMRQERLSPRRTTRLSEIMTVKAEG